MYFCEVSSYNFYNSSFDSVGKLYCLHRGNNDVIFLPLFLFSSLIIRLEAAMLSKREVFVWKRCHEEVLLAEVSTVEPYKFKAGTKERGKAWREVSENLNGLIEMGFKTTHRSVREKFDKMMKDFEGKEIEERRASGVDVDYSDIGKALQDIKERIAEVEEEKGC